MPSTRFIRRSITTTSTSCCGRARRAPRRRRRTRRRSRSRLRRRRIRRSPERTSSWSSTSSTSTAVGRRSRGHASTFFTHAVRRRSDRDGRGRPARCRRVGPSRGPARQRRRRAARPGRPCRRCRTRPVGCRAAGAPVADRERGRGARPTSTSTSRGLAGRVLGDVGQRLLQRSGRGRARSPGGSRGQVAAAASYSTGSPASRPGRPARRCPRRTAAAAAPAGSVASTLTVRRMSAIACRPTCSASASAAHRVVDVGAVVVGHERLPGAGDVQHRDAQRVRDQVVDLAGDALPLGQRRPLALALARAAFGRQRPHLPPQHVADDEAADDLDDVEVDARVLTAEVVGRRRPPTIDAASPSEPRPAPSVAVTDATRKIAAAGARFSGPCASNGMVISQPTAVSMKTTSTHHGTHRSAKYWATPAARSPGRGRGSPVPEA